MNRLMTLLFAGLITLFGLTPDRATAQEPSAEELAKELSNPVADLISVPFQFNYDEGLGLEGDARRDLPPDFHPAEVGLRRLKLSSSSPRATGRPAQTSRIGAGRPVAGFSGDASAACASTGVR